MQTVTIQSSTARTTPRWAAAATAAVVGLTILAAFAMGSYVIPGSGVIGGNVLPVPIRWIARVLVVESWPTYETLEIRWVAWAIGALVLTVLAGGTARRWSEPPAAQALLAGLAGYCVLLMALVAMLSATTLVPELGLAWTWQLALALSWMLVLYWWATRLPIATLARAVGLSLASLAAISLLYSLQGSQRYPNWPVGNVLLLTTGCLAGIFLLGTWAYGSLIAAVRGCRGCWAGGLAVSALLLLVAIATSLSGRRAGLLGLAAGGGLILLLWLARYRHGRTIGLAMVLAAVSTAAVLVPQLFKSGRWETVVLRAELYNQTRDILLGAPDEQGRRQNSNLWTGIGPGQLGGHLTFAMRPLHAESPRLFHGEISEHAHSEPLHAVAELGLPVGLLYLALPLGGLAGYIIAYRRLQEQQERFSVLGLAAALAAVMAAESTSVGMRHPGVAALAWALVGIGYACGARTGGFAAVARFLEVRAAAAGRYAAGLWVCWLSLGAALCVITVWSMAGAWHLANGLAAWNRDQMRLADVELDKAVLPQEADPWMLRQYLRGRVNLVLARQATDPQQAAAHQARAIASLDALVGLSPAYKDAPVWLGRATGNAEQLTAFCELLRRVDPYSREALLVLASRMDKPADRLPLLRASLRNEDVIGPLARMIASDVQDPAGWQVLQQWLAEADKALPLTDPAAWPDPLSLETYRMAVIVYGERGDLPAAAAMAERAAVLCGYLERDVRRRRPEAVELETYLDRAWFGWMSRPEAQRPLRAQLEEQADVLIAGEPSNFSGRMALQLLAMLRLTEDKQREAFRDLLVVEGAAARRQTVSRLMGLAYARLVAIAQARASSSQPAATQVAATQPVAGMPGPAGEPAGIAAELAAAASEPSAQNVDSWIQQGQRILGEQGWSAALQAAAARWREPWWHGVLSE